MLKKSTDELNKILKSNIPISQYLKENAASFHKLTLPQTFELFLKENKVTKAQAVRGADLERTHGYQVLNGTRNPTRDSVILFGILHHMNLQEINELLYQNRLPILGK